MKIGYAKYHVRLHTHNIELAYYIMHYNAYNTCSAV